MVEVCFSDASVFGKMVDEAVRDGLGFCGESGVGFGGGCRYRMISETLFGFEERVMMVVVPADVASLAATILVAMPPIPRLEPADDTSAWRASISGTCSIGRASGNFLGFLSYRQSTSVMRKR